MTTIILGQISKLRSYEQQYGPLCCYTMTVKAVDPIENVVCLAPSKAMVYGHKGYTGYAPYDDAQYTQEYVARLNGSMKTIASWYRAQSVHDMIALCCFCRKGAFCHRTIVYHLFLWLNDHLNLSYDIVLE